MKEITDPGLKSFLNIAPDSDFPIQNLPYGIFQPDALSKPRGGVAIGEWILDLSVLEENGFFYEIVGQPSNIFSKPTLNLFLEQGPEVWHATRAVITRLLREDEPVLRDNKNLQNQVLVPQAEARLSLPVQISNYTDFYSSEHHARNVGEIFRGRDKSLLPNWKYIPIAYHGRASSIVLSHTSIYRPYGQILAKDQASPTFGPTQFLDFEVEIGAFVGCGNELGQPIPMSEAQKHLFGMVLVNDWSARDIQLWEYQPLGPFLAKSFATSISPWIVPFEALDPFRCKGPEQTPEPLPYLQNSHPFSFDINLEVAIQTEKMAEAQIISRTNTKNLYWDLLQQVTHHTSNGCNLQTGDLLASGTISGPDPESYGSMLELTWNKSQAIKLDSGEIRFALEDGDTIILKGWCQGDGYRIGLGNVTGKILAAKESRL